MSSAPDIFMQEQQAKLEFARAISDLRSLSSNPDSPQFVTAFDALTEAALRFGTCELRMRRGERLEALNRAKVESKQLKSTALSNNKRGLAALAGVRPFVDELSATESGPEILALWRKSSPGLRAEWRDLIAEVNVSAENALHLVRIMDECCDAIDKNGSAGLGTYLSTTLAELENQRRSPNRGTQEASFPWWKIVMAALILGMYIYLVYDLVTKGAPWWDLYLVNLVTMVLMLCLVLGC